MGEEWRDIKGYEGIYQVSNLGRIKSLRFKKRHNPIVKQTVLEKSYPSFSLYRDRRQQTVCTHRIVAQAFIPNPENKPDVNHINGIKTDNRVENLEWVTTSENALHSFHVLGNNTSIPKRKPVVCVETGVIFESLAAAAKWAGVRVSNISNVVHNTIGTASNGNPFRYRTAGGYHWKFPKDM